MSAPTIESTAESLRVTMRAPRAVGLVVFLALWFTGWTFGGISAIRALISAESLANPASLFLLVWLAGWLAGELFAGALLGFLINGREILELDAGEVRLRIEALGRAWTRHYAQDETGNLRPARADDGSRTFLAFDFEGRTVRFGTDLNESDTLRVAQAVWERFPSLSPLYTQPTS